MSAKQPNPCKRDGERVQVELDIDLSTYERYYLSKLTNVSIGGAFVRSHDLQPVGTEVKLRFKLPGDSQVIEAEGKVVWTYDQRGDSDPNSTGMGISFTRILQSDRDRIRLFVAQYTSTKA